MGRRKKKGRKAGGKGRKKLEDKKGGGKKKCKRGRKEKSDRKKNWDPVEIEPMPGLKV